MNLTEDQLRAVLTEAGDEIGPDRLRPLDLQVQRASRLGARDRTVRWRRSRWVQGLAAAAAVAAIAVAATAIATGPASHRGDGRAPSAVSPSATAHARGLPPYYVVIASKSITTVRDTRTGAVLATVHPPGGDQFSMAAPGAGSDSFLLVTANQIYDATGVYLLRFSPADRTTSLTRVPIPLTIYARTIAMSPAGTEVAVVSLFADKAGELVSRLQIYALSGRLIRQWQDQGILGAHGWSWAVSGYLAFSWDNDNNSIGGDGIRLIPAAAASGSVLRASRLVVPFSATDLGSFLLSGNGARIAADVVPGLFGAFEEFSTTTGKLTGRYWPGLGTVYWSNRTGSTLIVSVPSRNPRFPLGILTRGRFTPLPSPAEPWLVLAF